MASEPLGALGEKKIIKMLAEALGIQELDDASPMDEECEIFLSSDMMLQGTDIPENTHPLFWGMRFVAANVSDISAMGCRPISMSISLGLPADMDVRAFSDLLEGMRWACRESDLRIIGGDTNSAPELILSGFISGMPFGEPFRRRGARAGDGVYVTGNPGSAALGLALIKSSKDVYFDSPDVLEEEVEGSAAPIGAFLVPELRIKEAEDLSKMGIVTSCIDISDGLSTDAGHIAESSSVRIVLDPSKFPLPPESAGIARSLDLSPEELALNGGDDYELLFTASKEAEETLRQADLAVRIGEVVEGSGVALRRGKSKLESLKSSGYQHFPGKLS